MNPEIFTLVVTQRANRLNRLPVGLFLGQSAGLAFKFVVQEQRIGGFDLLLQLQLFFGAQAFFVLAEFELLIGQYGALKCANEPPESGRDR
jgi:hypothetical protein